MSDFAKTLESGYVFSGLSLPIGVAKLGEDMYPDTVVSLPLATMNRHGLISGATGTGKTKTIQKILEQLSHAGVSSLMMDMKGDVSGVAMSGEKNAKIEERLQYTPEVSWETQGFPTEFFSILSDRGVQLRTTVSEFGPTLFSRMLGLTDAQSGALFMVFRYADDAWLLLVDLNDLRTVITYLAGAGKDEIKSQYGNIAPATFQVLVRKIMELESQGGSVFFGEPSLEIEDLMEVTEDGKWRINVVRLTEAFQYPKIFMTFMVSILSEMFQKLPEVWDLEKPKFVLFIDEAHLLFRDISKEFLEELEAIIKLIRSKGVGVFFCTQNPTDIPEGILAQLGIKIQHALRAFTAKDHEAIKKSVKNFPVSPYYDLDKEITTLGTGEALITVLSEKWLPTPIVRTMIFPPESRMNILTDNELKTFLAMSPLFAKYRDNVDPESAHEILSIRIQEKALEKEQELAAKERKKNPTVIDTVTKTATKSIATEVARSIGTKIGGKKIGTMGAQIARGILGSIFR